MEKWRFPSNDYGENKGINDTGVAMFRGTPLKSLAREICQNSLDAATQKKVIIEFDMFSVPSSAIPGKKYLLDAFHRCLDFWGTQKTSTTKEFFNNAINAISNDSCDILRISDFNTTGLTGSRKEINTDWTNLTKSSGASDKKGTAGGSYGIGKFAPFACSAFSTVFYSTYDIFEEKAMQGVSRLVTFTREDGQNTQGTGYFGNEMNTPVYEELKLEESFTRKNGEYGTDIYIVGYKYAGENWQKDIIVSILEGFLGAIWNEKLEVKVGEIYISKSELSNIMDAYNDDLTNYTDKFFEVLVSEETVWFEEDFYNMGEIKLGLLLGNVESPNKISMIRQTGMKIMDKDRLPGHVPLTGVMFIEGQEINERLRMIENPEHTKWEPERSNNPNKERQLLKSLNDFIKLKIEELISSGAGESIDAVGVGRFIPDEISDTDNQTTEEVVSERILEVEINQVKKKSTAKHEPGSSERNRKNEELGHMEKGGNDTEWFHDNGKTENPDHKPGQEAHAEHEGDIPMPTIINVGIERFVCMGVDKDAGKYMLMIVPNQDGLNGKIELFLSAETQKYEAPIKNAKVIGKTSCYKKNIISGLTFTKGQPIRISLELDYFDYCSMEVVMYATSK